MPSHSVRSLDQPFSPHGLLTLLRIFPSLAAPAPLRIPSCCPCLIAPNPLASRKCLLALAALFACALFLAPACLCAASILVMMLAVLKQRPLLRFLAHCGLSILMHCSCNHKLLMRYRSCLGVVSWQGVHRSVGSRGVISLGWFAPQPRSCWRHLTACPLAWSGFIDRGQRHNN